MLINYWRAEKITLSLADQKLIQVAQKQIPSNFCTIDFARTASGQLIIMEMGDGQVSGLQGYDESTFYKSLRKSLDLDL